MLDVKPMRQTPSYCGPFCLKMVFDYYGKIIDEKEIAKVAGTVISKGNHGTHPKDMVRAAKHFGFNAEYKENSDLDELENLVMKKKVPVIINWFYEDEGHYSVVVGIDKKNIYFIDPEDANHKKMSLLTFKKIWFDYTGDYVDIHSDFRIRPIVIVTPKSLKN